MKNLRNRILMLVVGAMALTLPVFAEDTFMMENNAIYHFQKAQQWMTIHQYNAAIEEYQIAIRLKPSTGMSATLYNDLAMAYLKVGMPAKAIVSLQQAIALSPNFDLYYANLARAYQQTGALPTAIQKLESTTASNAKNAQAWYLLGHLYRTAHNTERAHHAFEAYIRLVPHSELTDAAKLNLIPSSSSQSNPVDVKSWQRTH